MNDHMNLKLEQLLTLLLPEGIFPVATVASRWLIFKLLFPHHFKTLPWDPIKLFYLLQNMPKHSFTSKSCAPAAVQVELTSQSGWSLLLFAWRWDKCWLVTKQLCTHTLAWGAIGPVATPGHRYVGNYWLCCAGNSASFLAVEPTPKQQYDLLPRFLQLPWTHAGTGVRISGQVAVIIPGSWGRRKLRQDRQGNLWNLSRGSNRIPGAVQWVGFTWLPAMTPS